MLVRKIIFHVKAAVILLWYRLIYRGRLSVGKNITFRKDFNLMISPDAHVTIGDNCFFNNHCSVNARARVAIGADCMFGESVKIYDHDHRFQNPLVAIAKQGFSTLPVIIGEGCWIASNVCILKGTEIGAHSVIGAGCVVKEEVEPYSIVTLSEVHEVRVRKDAPI